MTAYATLIGTKATTGSLRSWCNHASIPAETCVAEAEAWIYQRILYRDMQFEEAVTAAAGVDAIDLDDFQHTFLAQTALLIDGDSQPLDYVSEIIMSARRLRDSDGNLYTGSPSCWTVLGNQILFDTELTEALSGTLWYYGAPTALATAGDNFLTRQFPTLLRHVCMAFGYEFMKRNDSMAGMFALADSDIRQAGLFSDRFRRGQII